MRPETKKPTDFDLELERINRALSEVEGSVSSTPFDSERATRFVHALYQRASLTGRLDELKLAEEAIERVIPKLNYPEDLLYLKANINFKLHDLEGVRRSLETSSELRASVHGRVLQADLLFQEGRIREAEQSYEALIREDRVWDDLARLAYLKFKMGEFDRAEELYTEAEDELTAKEMRHFAWVELQRGVLKMACGRLDEARTHYERADRAYSGYWLVHEHMAELSGAQGRYEEAIALYRKLAERLPRPEFYQSLGELYRITGKVDEAEARFEKALGLYMESVGRGEVHYYHHLVDFYADVRRDGREAVRWARKDLELRENFSTQTALAWAMYRAGEIDEALSFIERALSSGARDAHLFSQAATIYRAANESEKAERYAQLSKEINPHHGSFHVHR